MTNKNITIPATEPGSVALNGLSCEIFGDLSKMSGIEILAINWEW